VSVAFVVDDALSNCIVELTPVKVNVSIIVPAMPDRSVRRTNVTSLTFPLSGATIDASVPFRLEVNCIATLTMDPAITDDASQDNPDVNVGVVVPFVE
jgi:hypothetical protein